MKSKDIRVGECYLSRKGSIYKVSSISTTARGKRRIIAITLNNGDEGVVTIEQFRSLVRDKKGNLVKEVLRLPDEVLVREGFVLTNLNDT